MDDLSPLSLELRPIGPEHAELLARWRAEPSSRLNNPALQVGPEELRAQIRRLARDLSLADPAGYRWVVLSGERVIGSIALKSISRQMLYGELGYHIGEGWQGRGFGRRAIGLAVETIFRDSPLVRLFAHVAGHNERSQRLLLSLGFQREGVLRQHYVIGERRIDQVVLGILKDEWLERPFESHL